MTPIEFNKFRHIAGAAQSAKDIGLPLSVLGGIGKEVQDRIYGDSWNDTKTDWQNNMRGWNIHRKYPNLEDEQLSDHVFNNYIKPYRK